MAGARRFYELHCWQLSDELKNELYRVARRRAVRRDSKFVGQLRDAAASAPRTIAEGFGRRTHKDFAHFLDYARASLNESQGHIKDACDRRYITLEEFTRLIRLARRATAATAGLQRYLRNTPDPPDSQ
jgi:four helix bundle protein